MRSPDSRRESVWSTISIIKSKLGGKSNNSFENIREERFWEILGNNNNEEKTEAASTPQVDVSLSDKTDFMLIYNIHNRTKICPLSLTLQPFRLKIRTKETVRKMSKGNGLKLTGDHFLC